MFDNLISWTLHMLLYFTRSKEVGVQGAIFKIVHMANKVFLAHNRACEAVELDVNKVNIHWVDTTDWDKRAVWLLEILDAKRSYKLISVIPNKQRITYDDSRFHK